MRNKCLLVLTCLLASITASYAIDGVAVTVHWQGSFDSDIGGCGTIWRHNIANWVVSHTKIYDGCARCPRLDPRDASRVAFIGDDGKICIMPVTGGAETVLATGNADGHMDWAGERLYYSMGAPWTSGSRTIRRVNVNTKADEQFVSLNQGIQGFHISADEKRMAIRGPLNWPNSGTGTIYLYDMAANSGQLDYNRSWGAGWHCQESLSPSGDYATDGWDPHTGVTVRKWSDMSKAADLNWSVVDGWGPGAGIDLGGYGFMNTWSSNSDDWMCIRMGWDDDVCFTAGNLVLVNWKTQEKLALTNNASNSNQYDGGDFWLGTPSTSKYFKAIDKNESPAFAVRPISVHSLAVTIERNKGWSMNITDLSGKRTAIQTSGQGNASISIPRLAAGAYLAHVKDMESGMIITRKLYSNGNGDID